MRDWKETLFVWKGKFSWKSDDEFEWIGSWLPVQAGQHEEDTEVVLTDEAFACSENTFTLQGKFGDDHAATIIGGSYQLDNGDGHEAVEDYEQHFRVFNEDGVQVDLKARTEGESDTVQGPFSVAAWGSTQFGYFCSRGYLKYPLGEPTPTLILARRYLRDTDPRVGHAVKELSAADAACCDASLFSNKMIPYRMSKTKSSTKRKRNFEDA